MEKRKVLSVFIAIAIVFCYMPITSVANAVSISHVERSTIVDMPSEGFWSTQGLKSAVNNSLLSGFEENGSTYIKPNDPLTRAQMLTVVNHAFGTKELASISGVDDVSSSSWYYNDIQKSIKMGSIALDSKIRPNDSITREEAITILVNILKIEPGTTSDLARFSDLSDVSTWAIPAMASMVKAGYLNGTKNLLSPKATMTRAEFCVIMDNVIKVYITNAGTLKNVSTGNVMVNVDGVILEDVTINGNLIIGDGVGDGAVTLNNVIVKGNIIARGGGLGSIIISSGSVEGKIIIAKVDGKIRVFIKDRAKINLVEIEDGIGEIIIEGRVGTVEVTSAGTPIIIRNADIENIEVNTIGASNITIQKDSTVVNMVIGASAIGTKVFVYGKITHFITYAQNTVLSGSGTVNNVKLESSPSSTTNKTVLKNNKTSEVTVPETPTDAIGDPIDATVAVSSINIFGEPKVGIELIAKPLQTDATLIYQWIISDTIDGIYSDIPNATSKTYIPITGDKGKFIKVVATGIGKYLGTMTSYATAEVSEYSDPISYDTLIHIKEIPGIVTPVSGEPQVTTPIDTEQYKGTVSWLPLDSKFREGSIYTATITLTPKPGFTLDGVAQDYFTISGATATNNDSSGIVIAMFPETEATPDSAINLSEIPGVVMPVRSEAPITTTIDTVQYSGTISWSPSDSVFKANTVYTATIALTPKFGFTLDGVPLNYFKIAGATLTNNINSGVVSAIFPATSPVPDTIINLGELPRMKVPATDDTPFITNIDTVQYTGTYTWSPSDKKYLASTVYTATIILIPKPGFTLEGIPTNFFKVTGATATNNANSGVIKAVFPETLVVEVEFANISGIAKVGETLTAISNPGAKNLTYKWQSSDKVATEYKDISGETFKTLVLKEELKGKFIRVVIFGDKSSNKTSDPTTKVQE